MKDLAYLNSMDKKMLNNLRRKRVQDINNASVFKTITQTNPIHFDMFYVGQSVGSNGLSRNLGSQRYAKIDNTKSFDSLFYSYPDTIFGQKFKYEIKDIEFNMILCPSGSFLRGDEDEWNNNPIKLETIDKPFLLSESEITQEMYTAIIGKNPSIEKDKPSHPVENVSWIDAAKFCNALSDICGLKKSYEFGTVKKGKTQTHYLLIHKNVNGFRLPMGKEWEYAAKAGTQLKYSGSDYIEEVAWCKYNRFEIKRNVYSQTRPVKQLNPNAWGFYDMTGNVYEWCENSKESKNDHIGSEREARGGAYSTSDSGSLVVASYFFPCDRKEIYTGFRIARYL